MTAKIKTETCITRKITIELDDKDVERMIRDHVRAYPGDFDLCSTDVVNKKAFDVEFDCGYEYLKRAVVTIETTEKG